MNIVCAICKDHLVQSDDIFHTRCAHVFHFQCLTQWLERSKSCPQCREKVTQSRIHRLYFTFSNNEPVEPQTCSSKEKIDSLKFKILLKEKDIQYFTSKTVTLEKQNAGLKQEVRKVESEISKKNSTIHELREEIKYCDNLKKEIVQLKSKIEDLKPIQTLLHAPISDVSRMVGNTKDPETLTTYISVMKKELLASFDKRKQLRMTVKRLQEELTKVNMKYDSLLEEQSKRMELEVKLAFSESKSMSLQKRVDELEEVLGINEKCSSVSELQAAEIQSNTSDQNLDEKMSKREKNKQETMNESLIPTKRKKEKVSTCSTNNTEDELSSFQIKDDSTDAELNLLNCSSSSDSSIAFKRSRMSTDDVNTLNKSDNSKSTKYTIPKKKKENKQDRRIIDLT